jgi:predicted porin
MNQPSIKLSAIAIAVAAFAAQATAADSVSIYGVIDAGTRIATQQATAAATVAAPESGTMKSMVSGGLSSSRLGFQGTEHLGGGLTATFQLESGLASNTGSLDNTNSILFNRTSTVGLTNGTHSLLLGRQYSEAYFSLQEVDPLGFKATPINTNVLAGALNDTTTFGNQLTGQSDMRTNSAVRYDGNFGNFKTGLQYSFGGVTSNDDQKSSYGLRASYNFGTVVLSSSANRLNDSLSANLMNYTIGAKWNYTPTLALAATYADQKVSGGSTDGYKRQISSVGAYWTPNSTSYGLAYYGTNSSRIDGVVGTDGRQDKLVALSSYSLSKRTSLYSTVDYSVNHDALVPTNTRQSNMFGLTVGVNHSF